MTTNPVLTPIRRWVLYSRTNLAITVVGVMVVLFAVGAAFGETPAPATAADGADSTAEPVATTDTISYDLDEVSESLAVAKSAAWVASSAPATAMSYAHAFVDTTASDSKWASTLGRYTVDRPGETIIAARPRTPVVITGPTVSTLVDGPAGAQGVQVVVPTQAGDMKLSLTVEEKAGGKRWVVGTPLPTLDLSKVAAIAPPASTEAPRTSTPETTTAAPTSTAAKPSRSGTDSATSTTPEPTVDLDEDDDLPSRDSSPVPVTGPIPIPDLDTPIPGER
ncbi:hypothetical protein [Prescottella subtropica]|uniref:hypothetical protein n=1 Tax=Prescottella subtropica TaxID=2545757 RepID=UPI0010F5EB32|nr:hypothetical protein [Prescottella subtropica]